MTAVHAELDRLIREGPVADIFRMERAQALLKVIGEHAAVLNDPVIGHFGELFGALQTSLTVDAVMAVARLFDRPNARYPTRCLRHVLEFVRTHKDELLEIREAHQLGLSLQAAELESKLGPLVPQGGTTFAQGLVDHFLFVLDSEEVARELDLLKTLRDKGLAHNEDVAPVAGPTWGALTDLAGIAKRLVGILGWAYLGTAYEIDGQYELSYDAGRPALDMVRLAEHLQTARLGAARP